MAVRVKLDDITPEQKKIIRKYLLMQPKDDSYFKKKQRFTQTKDPICIYSIDKPKNEIVLPYTFGNTLLKYHINSRLTYPDGNFNMVNTELRPHQVPIIQTALEHLKTKGTTTLGVPPGSGKTVMSTYLASLQGGVVLVISPLTVVHNGWLSTFEKFTDAKIWVNDGKTPCPSSLNIILTMDTMFHKIPSQILSVVRTLIIDEAHMFCTPGRIHCLLGTTPKYVIACTATPYRTDEMESILHAICGTHGIFIKPTKHYTVYKYLTGIKTEIEKTKSGGANWPKLVKDLADDPKRNAIILDLVIRNPSHKIMILTWNKSHAYFLCELFREHGISADVLAGNKSNYQDSRVLVATFAKSGVGFDECVVATDWNGVRLNMMLLTGSTKNVYSLCQFVGRVFRADSPIIIDFVDDNRITKSHWRKRVKWYEDPDQNGTVIEVTHKNDNNNGENDVKDEYETTRDKIRNMHKNMIDRVNAKK